MHAQSENSLHRKENLFHLTLSPTPQRQTFFFKRLHRAACGILLLHDWTHVPSIGSTES